jgi:NAD(P)-dependent dehydrogenase (short-subunit alcohol dehydrogenase family)
LAALGGRMAFDDLDGARSYRPWRAYCQSKLANLLFTVELGRRLQASAASVLAVAAHPGYAATNLQATSAQAKAGVRRALEGTAMALGNLIIAQPAAAGALPSLYAATATGVVGGGFYGPQGPFGTRGAPGAAKLPSRAKDAAVAQQLWEISQQRTGVAYAELAAARA